MRIYIFEPFAKGFRRMTNDLFRNFDIRKWFVVGFAAFLAQLADFNSGGSGYSYDDSSFWRRHDWWDVWHFPGEAWQWLLNNAVWFFIGTIILFVIIAITLLLLWLSSRGKFIFLDNVVHNKAEISKPWNSYGKLGNSLFLLRIILSFIGLFIILSWVVTGFLILFGIYQSAGTEAIFWVSLGIGVLLLFVLILLFVFVDMLVNDFLVPIMYKFDLTAVPATRRLIELVLKHFGSFILYGLLKLVLMIGVFVAIMFFGFFTCCIGFILVIIPYISDVFLLPVSYTFRSFSVEFLEQFGDEYKLFPAAESQVNNNV